MLYDSQNMTDELKDIHEKTLRSKDEDKGGLRMNRSRKMDSNQGGGEQRG